MKKRHACFRGSIQMRQPGFGRRNRLSLGNPKRSVVNVGFTASGTTAPDDPIARAPAQQAHQ
jgi:hypothetical protein